MQEERMGQNAEHEDEEQKKRSREKRRRMIRYERTRTWAVLPTFRRYTLPQSARRIIIEEKEY
jgi:hypothetical protein